NHLYLYFRGVNERGWVYVNGEPAFEGSWTLSSDVKRYLKQGSRNRIAIGVTHSSGLGGISYPAMLIGTDEECTAAQLNKYRF
ncbi:MAG: hypothetical protein ABII89_08945, partial [Candidatus Omnitrophota bacterium]